MPGFKHADITSKIIGCAMKVHRILGLGFPEIIYQRCMIIELKKAGLNIEVEVDKEIFYEGVYVGSRRLDLLVDNSVIVELKAISKVEAVCANQILNYLKVFKLEVGLLINFGEKSLVFNRFVL